MPFGIKGAPRTFQKLMSKEVLVCFIDKFCKAYLDDVLIFSKCWKEPLKYLSLVIERLRVRGLTAYQKKVDSECLLWSFLALKSHLQETK